MDNLSDDRRGMLKAIGHGTMVGLMFLLIMSVKRLLKGFYYFIYGRFMGSLLPAGGEGTCLKPSM